MTLSKHQHAALAQLLGGPMRTVELAAAIGVEVYSAMTMLRVLADRGLVKIIGNPGAMRQVPRHYTCELTERGRRAAEERAA